MAVALRPSLPFSVAGLAGRGPAFEVVLFDAPGADGPGDPAAGARLPAGARYVLDPTQTDRARQIVGRYQRREPLKDPRSYRSWPCRACNELIEGQFELCWKCGWSL